MKKMIYILVAFVLITNISEAKQRKITICNDPFAGQTIMMEKTSNQAGQTYFIPKTYQKDYTVSNSKLPDFFYEKPEDQLTAIYSTRMHSYPQNPNDPDTARVLTSKSSGQPWYVGDRAIPSRVVNQNQVEIFKINGFAQFCPNLGFYFKELSGHGTFAIDTVVLSIYSYPDSPIRQSFQFAIVSVAGSNAGTTQFQGFDLSLEQLLNTLDDVMTLTPDSINAHITPVPGTNSFSIRSTILSFQNYKKMATVPSDQAFGFLIMKEDPNNLTDTLGIIGAWEWKMPNANLTFGSVICHYPNNTDTVSTLFNTLAPWRPNVPSDFPAMAAETYVRQNFTMMVRGTYDGPVNVEEVSNDASNFTLEQNYPNPVSESAKIQFTVQNSCQVNINVYNALGQLVSVLVDDVLSSGTYTTTLDVNNLPQGAYIYTMQAGSHSASKVLNVVK